MSTAMFLDDEKMAGGHETRLAQAKQRAAAIAETAQYRAFAENIRKTYTWRNQMPADVLDRDYLRVVDHHLKNLIPRVQSCFDSSVRRVIDFGCGSGGSAIALAMVYPDVRCCGTDIDADEIEVARQRAALYGVADRCEFHHVAPCERLPFEDGSFEFSLCSSVIEYATEPGVRKFCVDEMVRLVKGGGSLFFSVPNRLYPFEIHTGNWGWNWFPGLLKARTVDSTYWEVRKLARPATLKLHRTPLGQLFRPWSNFCVRKVTG